MPANGLPYGTAGHYAVGVITIERADGQLVEVWYPAVDDAAGDEESYDMRDFVPEAVQELLAGADDVDAGARYPGARDAEAATGRFPVVVFSHGFSGMRLQSTFLTSHLASHGMVVASTDHPSRDLFNVLGGTAASAEQSAVDDVSEVLDLLGALDAGPDGVLVDRVDLDRVAAVGHSAGGGTVVAAAGSDPRIDGYVSMASGRLGDASGDAAALPDVPSFFMAGELDATVPVERTRAAFEAAPAPTRLWVIADTGHNAFSDFCTFGDGTGIVGVAEAAGLGVLLEASGLRALGEDGCVEPAAPVEEVFPLIRHGVTAQLVVWLGLDDGTVDLDDATIDERLVVVEHR